MRIGKVIGNIVLSQSYPTLVGGRMLLLEVQDRHSLVGKPRKTTEVVVGFDTMGAGMGDLVAFTESREATMPFYPEKKVPLDAYCAAIIDHVNVKVLFE